MVALVPVSYVGVYDRMCNVHVSGVYGVVLLTGVAERGCLVIHDSGNVTDRPPTEQLSKCGLTPQSLPGAITQLYVSARSKEEFRKFLQAYPEPSPEELFEILDTIRDLSGSLRRDIREWAKGIPHLPGGHPRMIPTRHDIQRRVQKLVEAGESSPDAKAQAARELGISRRSVRRACQGLKLTAQPS